MKKNIILGLKVVLLTMIMFIGMAVSSIICGTQSASKASSGALIPVLIYCFINTLVLTLFILKSNLRGLKLVGANFTVFFGIEFFMTQIETLYFNFAVKMPLVEIIKVVISGALNGIIFSFLAVIILGKFKKETEAYNSKISATKALPNIVILAFLYVIIYFAFGYYVAWQFADLRYYYSGSTDILNIFAHLSNQFKQDPILILFQFFRGFLWAGLAVIIINSLGKINAATYITSALLFGVLIAIPLIFPNPYMPEAVRFGHSLELVSSMITFGTVAVFVLRNKLNVIMSSGNIIRKAI